MRSNQNRITVRHKGTRTSFTARNPVVSTSVEINGPLSGGRDYSILIESWRNTSPERCFYTHRTIVSTRKQALAWARDMLPMPVAL